MMANIYGVGAQHSAPRKGYSDFVQHTGTVMSGQLRLVLNESEAFRVSSSAAQTLPVTFGYSQTSSVRLTYRPRFDRPKLERLANPLMELDYRGSREMANPLISSTPTNGVSWLNSLILSKTCDAVSQYNPLNISENAVGVCRKTKHEKYSGSEVPTNFVVTCPPGMRKISHTPNQQIAGNEKDRTANPTLCEVTCLPADNIGTQNHTGISGEVKPWCRGVLQKFRKTSTGGNYETFVGQFSGASLDFLRCLRLISPCMAVTINCPVVSPSSFTDSIASTTSWGARACTFCDLLFTWSLCTTGLHSYMWNPVYIKKEIKKGLKWNPVGAYTGIQLMVFITIKLARPRGATNTARASNHNVIGANTMACQHSTQTRPKFVFLFLGTPNEFPNTTPTVLRVEADTEDEGRAKFVGWTLIFAAQIRTEAPCRLQLFPTDEGFMWVYEQRQTVKESSHA